MGKSSGGGDGESAVDAAKVAGEEARWLAREQTAMNRPSQVNPWGSTTWHWTGAPGSGGASPGTNPDANDWWQSGPADPVVPRPPSDYGGHPGDTYGGDAGGIMQPGDENGAYDPNKRGGNYLGSQLDNYAAAGASTAQGMTSKLGAPETGATSTSPDQSWVPEASDSTSVSMDPNMGRWTQVETLNPELQASLDAQFGQQRNRSELAQQLSGQLGDQMGTPHDFDQYGNPISFDPTEQRQSAEDAAYARATSRLDPQFNQQRQELEISLRNKGLRPGDQAYEAQMDQFGRQRTDAYEQARLGATGEGRAETGLGLQMNERANMLRQQQMQEDLFARGHTLDEINALMQGQEIQGSTPSASEPQTIADMLRG